MDKTFSWSGIRKEAKRVRWPKQADIWSNTGETVIFTVFFALFFILCDLLSANIMAWLGIGA